MERVFTPSLQFLRLVRFLDPCPCRQLVIYNNSHLS